MRKAKPKKRVILPDPVYGDVKVSKFVNHLMYDGKKSISYEIFYKALEIVKTKMASEEKDSLQIWKEALGKITPQVVWCVLKIMATSSREVFPARSPIPLMVTST